MVILTPQRISQVLQGSYKEDITERPHSSVPCRSSALVYSLAAFFPRTNDALEACQTFFCPFQFKPFVFFLASASPVFLMCNDESESISITE